ncbi:serine protease 33-like isoform X1 [Alosa sapidissima]|uniref:serine protease 33-like isoform X1 n=1 Tax=Alosa sapidissima TaxID=34773 RepID=UPI001C081FF6|nr:serine protease 33-like isoform X1 [Alosa sapidissima]
MGLRTLLCVTLLLHYVTACVCARLRSSIIGGHDAHKGAWPWMVYLEMFRVPVHHISNIKCGGSLISDQWVMTAGHCWNEEVDLKRSFARVGELSLKEPSGTLVKLKRVVVHPDYSYQEKEGMIYNDMALVQLQDTVSFSHTVKPVDLPSPRDIRSDAECWVTGWGHVAENKPLGGKETLQEVRVSLVDDITCRRLFPKMTDGMTCAGDLNLNRGKDACSNDSGGPLVCVPAGDEKRRFVQVGIVSFGKGCGRKGRAGVYTYTPHYAQFIHKTINTTYTP